MAVSSSREPALRLDRSVLDVARQFFEAVVADLHAEMFPGDVLDFMSFVENDRLVVGDDRGVVVFPEREVGEKEVVVDDDDVGLGGPLVHQSDEAAVELFALLAGAELAAGVETVPDGAVLRQFLELGAVSGFGLLFPGADEPAVLDFDESGQGRALLGFVELLAAEVVVAALHVGHVERAVEIPFEERDVLVVELLLQVLRAGRDDDAFAAGDDRNQVGEGFPRAGAGLDQQMTPFGEHRFDLLGHGELPGPELVMGELRGKQAVLPEKAAGAGGLSALACSYGTGGIHAEGYGLDSRALGNSTLRMAWSSTSATMSPKFRPIATGCLQSLRLATFSAFLAVGTWHLVSQSRTPRSACHRSALFCGKFRSRLRFSGESAV